MVLATGLLSLLSGSAMANVLLNFDSGTVDNNDWVNNFTETYHGAQSSWNSAQQDVDFHLSSDAALARYDTAPGDTTYDSLFLTDTLSYDVTVPTLFSGVSGQGSYGIGTVARIQPSSGSSLLLLAGFDNGSSVRIRFFSGNSTTSTTPGTAFYDATFDLTTGGVSLAQGSTGTGSTNTIAANSPIHIVMHQTSGDDPTFSLTLSDAGGAILTTGNVAFTANDNYNTAGALGLRFNIGTGGNSHIFLDNWAVDAVPEPASAGLLLYAGAGMLLRRRRAAQPSLD
jgi:hypothetical protein